MTGAPLIRPLVWNVERLGRLLRHWNPGDPRPASLVATIRTLERCERLARGLTPFDPSGL